MEPGHGILVAHDVGDPVGTVFLYPWHVVATARAPSRRRRRSSHFCAREKGIAIRTRFINRLGCYIMLIMLLLWIRKPKPLYQPPNGKRPKPFLFDLEGNCAKNGEKEKPFPFNVFLFKAPQNVQIMLYKPSPIFFFFSLFYIYIYIYIHFSLKNNFVTQLSFRFMSCQLICI